MKVLIDNIKFSNCFKISPNFQAIGLIIMSNKMKS